MLANEITLNNLQVQKSLFKAVLKHPRYGLCQGTENGRYLMINPAGAEFSGTSIEEISNLQDLPESSYHRKTLASP